MLEFLGVDEKVISLTIELLIKTIPPMALRAMTDTMNSMIQATGRIGRLGLFSFVNLLFSFIYGYFIIAYLEFGINGYCLTLFLYELTSFIICLYFYFFELEEEIRDCSISIFENLCWLISEILKTTFGTMYNIISKEMLLIILTIGKESTDVASFTLVSTIANILKSKSVSVTS